MKKHDKTNLAVIAISLLLAGIILLATKAPAPVTASATAILAVAAVFTAFFAVKQLTAMRFRFQAEHVIHISNLIEKMDRIILAIDKLNEKLLPYTKEAGRKKLGKLDKAKIKFIKNQISINYVIYYNSFETCADIF